MEEDKDAFYLVRKGDVVGLYKTFEDCQNQVGSSVFHPPVSVYRGHCLSKEAEEHLVSHGLKNASYTINVKDLLDDIFGELEACPIQEPPKRRIIPMPMSMYRIINVKDLQDDTFGKLEACPIQEPDSTLVTEDMIYTYGAPGYGHTLDSEACVLKFDGASDRNSGKFGAGAVLYPDDNTAVIELRQGLGFVSKTYAEYTALILGLKHALKRGYKKIRVEGDSKLVCYQVQGTWKPNIHQVDLLQVVSDLKKKFVSFEMKHVFEVQNSGAYLQAHRAIKLGDGKVEVHITKYVKRTVH